MHTETNPWTPSPFHKPFTAAMIVPTGIGASIGGYGGDASMACNLLASAVDILMTHPNVVNAAGLFNFPTNGLYVEGYALDQFFKGTWALKPNTRHRIGVVFDAGISQEVLTIQRNAVNATQTIHGLNIVAEVQTKEALSLNLAIQASGISSGQLNNPQILLESCDTLIKNHDVTAIALCAKFSEALTEADTSANSAYASGHGVDPIGGLEAILSHTVVSSFQIPCAHAPAFSLAASLPETTQVVDPRAASEFITPTFLPCILQGLSKAPQYVAPNTPHSLHLSDLDALVIPMNACGGLPVLAALEHNIPIIVVQSNQTVLSVEMADLEKFFRFKKQRSSCVYTVNSYAEAAGCLLALKHGWQVETGIL